MIPVAILGTGAISDSHIRACQRFHDRCQIVALADLFPDKARAKAAQYGLDVPAFKNVPELLASVAFDLACVCLPPFEHAPATLALLEAGKHVLVEKPMATCLEECDQMLAAANASGQLLSVVAQNRFKTPVMKLQQILASGRIGRLLHAQVDSFWWRGSNYYDLWWRGTWAKEGGGCTLNHAVHHIDLFQWLLGMPSALRALTTNLNHTNSEVEDFSTAILSYPDGRIGQITASLVHHGEEQQFVIQTERAKIAVPWQVRATRQKENGFPETDPALEAELQQLYDRLPEVPFEGHDGQIANVLDAIEGRAPLLVDGTQGRNAIDLITAIYQSGQLDQTVRLPLTPDSPFYSRAGILQTARHFHEKTRNIENFERNDITLGRDYGR